MIFLSTECNAALETVRWKGYTAPAAGFLHNKQVTTGKRIILKKLISRLVSQATPLLVWNTKVHCLMHMSQSFGPTDNTAGHYPSRLTSVNALISLRFILKLTSHLRLHLPNVSCLQTFRVIFCLASDGTWDFAPCKPLPVYVIKSKANISYIHTIEQSLLSDST